MTVLRWTLSMVVVCGILHAAFAIETAGLHALAWQRFIKAALVVLALRMYARADRAHAIAIRDK